MKFSLPFALFFAFPALADCPSADDLAGGILVTETDGATNLFTALGGGVVQNDGTAPDGYTYRNILAQGTHLVELGDTSNGSYIDGTQRVIDYPHPREALPIPDTDRRWQVETNVRTATGEYPETQTQSWGALTEIEIGTCRYQMIPGKVVYRNEDYVVTEGLQYLPALRIALLNSYQVQGEPADIYSAISIEAVR